MHYILFLYNCGLSCARCLCAFATSLLFVSLTSGHDRPIIQAYINMDTLDTELDSLRGTFRGIQTQLNVNYASNLCVSASLN